MSDTTPSANALLASALLDDDQDAIEGIAALPAEAWPDKDMAALAQVIGELHAAGELPRYDAVIASANGNQEALYRAVKAAQETRPSADPARCARELQAAHDAQTVAQERLRLAALMADSSVSPEDLRHVLADSPVFDGGDRSGGWKAACLGQWLTTAPPEQNWIINNYVPRGIVGILSAKGGTGKSYLLLSLATGLAAEGRMFRSFHAPRPMRTLLIFGEDPEHQVWRRMEHILSECDYGEAELRAIEENLRIFCGHSEPLVHMQDRIPTTTAAYRWLKSEIETFRPDLVVIDPLNRFSALEENGNSEMGTLIAKMQDLCEGCSVLIAHHVAKASGTSRGASAITDGARWWTELSTLGPEDCKRFAIPEYDGWRYVKLANSKNSYGELASSIYFERQLGGTLMEVDLDSRCKARPEGDPEVLGAVATALARQLAKEANPIPATGIRDDRCGVLTRALEDVGERYPFTVIKAALDYGTQNGILSLVNFQAGNNREFEGYANAKR